ncbi:MAG: thioredoxin-disulfide reductase [Clostridia bacterium]|nr:thioredoxin-disulfide reductase [Clostridia bacterium]
MNYDLIIIGGGPAGMTAGIYSARAGLKVLLLEKAGVGGQVAQTSEIANYPGFASIDGFSLAQNMFEQMTALGVETIFSPVDKVDLLSQPKTVIAGGVTYSATSVILSMGASSRGLGVPSERKFIGRGVSYCATCDGNFFRGKDVVVVGGGNTALQDVLYLAPLVKSVTLVHRREGFRADEVTLAQFQKLVSTEDTNVFQQLNKVVVDVLGENKVSGISVRDVFTGEVSQIACDGVFVAIGMNPQSDILDGSVELDAQGYIKVNDDMSTNIPGVFGAGDVTHKSLRQVATAVSDGAIAGTQASIYVKRNR